MHVALGRSQRLAGRLGDLAVTETGGVEPEDAALPSGHRRGGMLETVARLDHVLGTGYRRPVWAGQLVEIDRPAAAGGEAPRSRSATVTSQPNNVGERSGWRRMKMSHLIEIAPSNTARVRRPGDG